MTDTESEKIALGTRVYWDANEKDQGYIVDKQKTADGMTLYIRWDDSNQEWIRNSLIEKVYKL